MSDISITFSCKERTYCVSVLYHCVLLPFFSSIYHFSPSCLIPFFQWTLTAPSVHDSRGRVNRYTEVLRGGGGVFSFRSTTQMLRSYHKTENTASFYFFSLLIIHKPSHRSTLHNDFFVGQQPPVGQGTLVIEPSR